MTLICKYEAFTNDVLLSCTMPELPRYVLQYDEEEQTYMGDAFQAMQKLLIRYRKLVNWMRANGIDVEAICGDDIEVMKMKS